MPRLSHRCTIGRGRPIMKFFVSAIVLFAVLPSGFVESRRLGGMSSKVAGSPEPPKAFVQEAILPELKFVEGLELAAVSGTGRMLMVERRGKVSSFDPRDGTKPVHLVVALLALHPDLEHAFGVALHPK